MAGTWEMLGTGGPVIVILALMSLLSLTVIAVKLIQLWPVRSGSDAREQALTRWKDGDRKQAQDSLAGGKSPADRVMAYAMQALQEGLRGPLLQDELQRRGNEEVSRMNSLIRLLELIAMVAPLLGLLGTVLGMIQSFQELELAQGAANASVLAGGIWQALLTTAAGLLVAIPAAIAAGLFGARIDAAAQAIESAAGRLLLIDGSR
ncbi:MotA/TolQ/ExbB proton channel family protein [Leisingera daeponensis]|uniref:MotA/TolQ/ExbB proton channel family protein n=1 Tax=Leisingera daeponensis TaxID=405746 RepID=UPI001C98219F|nr:MotA/TolQ/ExbB proton channel family protein [Leisingera daeponensis]MBY6058523.1 MotA/TolQ/ExbB proton channel family protein [Leisingera daeponensis]